MAEAYRLYAGTQAGMILFRGVGDIWTSMGGSREFEPYFKDKVVDSVYGSRQSPETVFAGVTFDGLYRTKDAGRHWQRVLDSQSDPPAALVPAPGLPRGYGVETAGWKRRVWWWARSRRYP